METGALPLGVLRRICSKYLAKSGKDSSLSLYQHSADAVQTADYLWDHVMPEAAKNAICQELKCPDNSRYTKQQLARRIFRLCMLLHDIGKTSSSMQSVLKYGFHLPSDAYLHTVVGALIVEDLLSTPWLSALIYAHHGKPVERLNAGVFCLYSLEDPNEFLYEASGEGVTLEDVENQKEIWKQIVDASLAICRLTSEDLPEISRAAQVLLCGWIILADWLASDEKLFPLLGKKAKYSPCSSTERFEQAMEKLHLPQPVHFPSSFAEGEFSSVCGFAPNDLQKTAVKAAEKLRHGGLMIIEAPMGSGKTEAAVAAAVKAGALNQSGGIFFGCPSRASSSQLLKRLQSWEPVFCKDENGISHFCSFSLLHSSAFINPDYLRLPSDTNEQQSKDSGFVRIEKLSMHKLALYNNIITATVDQALLSVLARPHFMLRLAALAGKVIILDEIHSYSPYMNQAIDRLLNWLGYWKTPVILLSATLPQSRRQQLLKAYHSRTSDLHTSQPASYPCITALGFASSDSFSRPSLALYPVSERSRKTVCIERIHTGTLEEAACQFVRNYTDDACLGILVSTVEQAVDLFDCVRKAFTKREVIVYHSRFTRMDRSCKEQILCTRLGRPKAGDSPEEIMARRRGLIVIGTQVLEQSLDLDVDAMLSLAAPMEALLQRSGRLQRHECLHPYRPACCSKATLSIWKPAGSLFDTKTAKIYHRWPLAAAMLSLPEKFTVPDDLPALVEAAGSRTEDPDCSELKSWYQDFKTEELGEKNCASLALIPSPEGGVSSTIAGMLATGAADSSIRKEALPSEDILILQKDETERFAFSPDGGFRFDLSKKPQPDDIQHLLGCQISVYQNQLNPVRDILFQNGSCLDAWSKENPLLKDMPVLLIDKTGHCLFETGQLWIYESCRGLVMQSAEYGASFQEES